MALLTAWTVTGHSEHGDGTSTYRSIDIEQMRGESEDDAYGRARACAESLTGGAIGNKRWVNDMLDARDGTLDWDEAR